MIVSTLYRDADTPIHRLHPLTKITAVGCGLTAAFAPDDARAGPLLLLLAILVTAMAARVVRPLLGSLLRIVLPIVVSLYLLQTVLAMARHDVPLDGGVLVVASRVLERMDAVGMRLVVFVASCLLVLMTTHPGRLIQALASRGAPPWTGYVVAAAFQVLPGMLAQARSIADAQRTRGFAVQGGPLARARGLIPLVAPLLLSVLHASEEQAMALEARGFGRTGPRTSLEEIPEAAWEPDFRRFALLGALVAVAWLRGWLRFP